VDEISAASIVAKVWRDSLMADMELQYPEYGFAKHKGYPTKLHQEALRKYGPSSIHRVTFAGVLSEK
jgi:ribonuclease HII